MDNVNKEIKTVIPAVNIREENKNVILEAEMAGLKKEDIKIEVNGDELIIKGEKKDCEPPKGYKLVYSERCGHKYLRSFILGEDVNKNKIDAKYENGLLMVKFAKNEEADPKKIEIK